MAQPPTPVQIQAMARQRQRRRKRWQMPIADFVPHATPSYMRPAHLAPFLDLLESAKAGEQVFACVSVPPRHSKTDTFKAAAIQCLLKAADTRIVYASYAAERAEEVGFDALRMADAMGVDVDPEYRRAKHWRTRANGGFRSVGIGGPLLGAGSNLTAIDDPIKNRQEAESRLMRNRAWDWIQNVAITRLEPGGSLILFHQRWHEDDPIGRAVDKLGWDEINLPALDDDGAPLWPERYDGEALQGIRSRVGEYAWYSQYMGRPRGREDRLFGPARTYRALPGEGLTWGAGADLAYSSRTSSDFTVFVVLARMGSGDDAIFYVVDVWRDQMETAETKARLAEFRAKYPQAGVPLFLGSGTEKGAGALLPLEWKAAVADKYTRAQPFAAAWNAGRVLVPEHGAPWLDDFLSELAAFTGAGDAHDDQIDASVGAFERLNEPPRRPFVFV